MHFPDQDSKNGAMEEEEKQTENGKKEEERGREQEGEREADKADSDTGTYSTCISVTVGSHSVVRCLSLIIFFSVRRWGEGEG